MKTQFGSYLIDTSGLDSSTHNVKGKKVFIQLPEGLQQYMLEIKHFFEKTYDVTVIIDANPTFGACDIPSESILKKLQIDLMIQFGHFPIPSLNTNQYQVPVFFINVQSIPPGSSVVTKSLPVLTGKRVGVITTAQHIHQLHNIKLILEEKGYAVVIGKGDNRIFTPGQILGCNFSAATSISDEIDTFLFVGSGFFHSLGLLLATHKPVVIADPYSNQVIDNTMLQEKKQQLLRQRYGAIAFAKQAKTVGVIIGLKPGQQREKYAFQLHKSIIKAGKKSVVLASDLIQPSLIDRFPFIDIFVSTACPRIAIDDYTAYKKPLLTPFEMEIAIGKKKWDDYVFDEMDE